MSDLAARLRALPAFPDTMPELDLETLPEDPHELFMTWLEEAIASGARQPHAMTFFWRESGRQVQVSGVVAALGEDVSQRDWLARPTSDGTPNPLWQVLALRPERIEFMQARADRRHVRAEYVREGEGWRHGPLPLPAS